eukprot:6491549-Amphidinium_carterae.1
MQVRCRVNESQNGMVGARGVHHEEDIALEALTEGKVLRGTGWSWWRHRFLSVASRAIKSSSCRQSDGVGPM